MQLLFRKHKQKPRRGKSAKTGNTQQTKTWRHTTNPKETKKPKLSRKEKQKLKMLKDDGIIILIDQVNLERGKRVREIPYHRLVDFISRRGHMSRKPRKVLKTYIITSKRHQASQGRKPSLTYLERNNIELITSPDERKGKQRKEGEWKQEKENRYTKRKQKKKKEKEKNQSKAKAVEATLVRIMTQQIEGIEVLRLCGIQPPKRKFCVVVSGQHNYMDVVHQAREIGCDVELWVWMDDIERSKDEQISEDTDMPGEWSREKKSPCRSKRCGKFSIKSLALFEEELGRSWTDTSVWREYYYTPQIPSWQRQGPPADYWK